MSNDFIAAALPIMAIVFPVIGLFIGILIADSMNRYFIDRREIIADARDIEIEKEIAAVTADRAIWHIRLYMKEVVDLKERVNQLEQNKVKDFIPPVSLIDPKCPTCNFK